LQILCFFKAILRNHRTNAHCPACNKPLGDTQIENYNYLPVKHFITKLLSSFTDVNQCETCKEFTTVESCLQCYKDQCDSCRDKHEETHDQTKNQVNTNIEELSKEELEILESIKKNLTEQEFEDLIQTAKSYLNGALSKDNGTSISIKHSASTSDTEKKPFWSEETIYDWSKHEKFTADDILKSKPERVRELLRLNFTPRPYQIRMVGAGLKRENSLVCLQTGAGKTFVCIIIYLYSMKIFFD
jgi:superfamily II RNA helicase